MIFNLATFWLVFLAMLLQQLIVPFDWGHGAFVFLVAVAFFCSAISVSYPVMLALAFFTGMLWDGLNVIIPQEVESSSAQAEVSPKAESDSETEFYSEAEFNPAAALKDIRFGYSILLFGLLGSLMQGLRPIFRRGRWELPIFMTGVGTFLFLLIQYLLVNFSLGGFVFPARIWTKILTTSLLCMLISPFIFFILHRLAIATGYQIRYEGLRRRFN